jgi:hypothetical protein
MVVNKEPKITEGKNLLTKLDETKLKPKAFFWLYFPNIDDWRLIMASKFLDKKNPKESYEELFKLFKSDSDFIKIELSNITIIHTEDKFLKLLRTVLKTGEDYIGSNRFKSNTINNTYIEDAIIHRMA